MSQPRAWSSAASRKAQGVWSPDLGTRVRMSHLSFLSQSLETAVYIFGGGGFSGGGRGVGGRHLHGSFTGLSDHGGGKVGGLYPLRGPTKGNSLSRILFNLNVVFNDV